MDTIGRFIGFALIMLIPAGITCSLTPYMLDGAGIWPGFLIWWALWVIIPIVIIDRMN